MSTTEEEDSPPGIFYKIHLSRVLRCYKKAIWLSKLAGLLWQGVRLSVTRLSRFPPLSYIKNLYPVNLAIKYSLYCLLALNEYATIRVSNFNMRRVMAKTKSTKKQSTQRNLVGLLIIVILGIILYYAMAQSPSASTIKRATPTPRPTPTPRSYATPYQTYCPWWSSCRLR
jgi:hypothetical protein